jgi:hypothetical protein
MQFEHAPGTVGVGVPKIYSGWNTQDWGAVAEALSDMVGGVQGMKDDDGGDDGQEA